MYKIKSFSGTPTWHKTKLMVRNYYLFSQPPFNYYFPQLYHVAKQFYTSIINAVLNIVIVLI